MRHVLSRSFWKDWSVFLIPAAAPGVSGDGWLLAAAMLIHWELLGGDDASAPPAALFLSWHHVE